MGDHCELCIDQYFPDPNNIGACIGSFLFLYFLFYFYFYFILFIPFIYFSFQKKKKNEI